MLAMKTIKKNKAQKENLVKGIENLVNEKKEKVEKSKKVLNKEEAKDPKVKEEGKAKTKNPSKDKLVKKVKEKAEVNLVEEVVTKREVKYLYPEGCEDTLSRKKFRQQVRNKIHQLELAMLRIKDQESKEYKKAQKEYLEYKKQYVKESVAI
jgi:hypothetical protein